jgi:hypothetical protein
MAEVNRYLESKTNRVYSISDPTYTVNEFCSAERMSRSMLYKMWAAGIGPDYYLVGSTRRITHHARIEFQRRREAAAKSAA